MLADVREGFAAIVARRWIGIEILAGAVQVALSLAPWLVLLPVLANLQLGGSASYAALLSAMAAGTVIGAIVGGRVRTGVPGVVACLALLPFTAALAGLWAGVPLPALVVLHLLAGIGTEVYGVLWVSSLQADVPSAVLGRVFSIDQLGAMALLHPWDAGGRRRVRSGRGIDPVRRRRRRQRRCGTPAAPQPRRPCLSYPNPTRTARTRGSGQLTHLTRPGPVPRGSTIMVVSPSSSTAGRFPGRVKRGAEHLESLGFRVCLASGAMSTSEPGPANVRARVEDLHEAFADPSVRVVMTSIGGWASHQILAHLDYDLIARNPKHFVGYSDTTALHLALMSRANLSTTYGPALMPQFGEYGGIDEYSWKWLSKLLLFGEAVGRFEQPLYWVNEHLAWDNADTRPRAPRMGSRE